MRATAGLDLYPSMRQKLTRAPNLSVNPALATGLPPSILRWQQDCPRQSCAGNRIAPVQHQQLGLGTVLARAQACDGVGPAVELSGLRHVVDAHDEGQAARKKCVSELRVEGQVEALPPRAVVIHGAAGEDVGKVRVNTGLLGCWAGQCS